MLIYSGLSLYYTCFCLGYFESEIVNYFLAFLAVVFLYFLVIIRPFTGIAGFVGLGYLFLEF